MLLPFRGFTTAAAGCRGGSKDSAQTPFILDFRSTLTFDLSTGASVENLKALMFRCFSRGGEGV